MQSAEPHGAFNQANKILDPDLACTTPNGSAPSPSGPTAMRKMLASIRRHYGANPLHLLVLLGCFALTGYAATRVAAGPTLPRILLWFAAALVAHDLILFPLYALADRSLTGAMTRLPHPIRADTATTPTEHPQQPTKTPTGPIGALPTAGLLVIVLATLIVRILRQLHSNPNRHMPKMVAPQRKRRP